MNEWMIPDPEPYFRQFIPERSLLLQEMEAEASLEKIPIIGPVVGRILEMLVTISRAQKILELGTATGYSTLWLAQGGLKHKARVTTVECSPGLVIRSRNYFRRAGMEEQIRILEGDARQILPNLNETFDFIFLDIDKEYYWDVLEDCGRCMEKGGILVADNTGFRDSDDFNRAIWNQTIWKTVHLYAFLPMHSPEHDGLCIATRI
jgi:predicted O-methyltransferase YrrM